LAAITASYVEATIENTVASLAAQLNAVKVDMAALIAALKKAN